jgi:hypothetical protein
LLVFCTVSITPCTFGMCCVHTASNGVPSGISTGAPAAWAEAPDLRNAGAALFEPALDHLSLEAILEGGA